MFGRDLNLNSEVNADIRYFGNPDEDGSVRIRRDEDGGMRVAENLRAALADPTGTPLQYKKVKLQGDEIAFIQNVADGPDDPTPTEQVVLWYNDSFTIRGDYSQQTYRIVVVPNESSMRYSMVNDGSSGIFRGGSSVNTEISVVVGLIDIDSNQFRKFDFLASEIGGRTGVLRLTGHIHANDSDEVAVAIQVNHNG